MSHWQKGKLKVTCSIAVLKRALINIMPEWEQHIKVDEQGRIPIYTYTGERMKGAGFHIMIPGKANPNYSVAPNIIYNDVGLRQTKDGKWEIQVDRSGIRGITNLEGAIGQEVAHMKARQAASLKKHQILKDEMEGADEVLVVRAPVTDRFKTGIRA